MKRGGVMIGCHGCLDQTVSKHPDMGLYTSSPLAIPKDCQKSCSLAIIVLTVGLVLRKVTEPKGSLVSIFGS